MHPPAPAPFNQDYCPGFSEALSLSYKEWCEANPSSTQDERREAHHGLQKKLLPNFPSIREAEVARNTSQHL